MKSDVTFRSIAMMLPWRNSYFQHKWQSRGSSTIWNNEIVVIDWNIDWNLMLTKSMRWGVRSSYYSWNRYLDNHEIVVTNPSRSIRTKNGWKLTDITVKFHTTAFCLIWPDKELQNWSPTDLCRKRNSGTEQGEVEDGLVLIGRNGYGEVDIQGIDANMVRVVRTDPNKPVNNRILTVKRAMNDFVRKNILANALRLGRNWKLGYRKLVVDAVVACMSLSISASTADSSCTSTWSEHALSARYTRCQSALRWIIAMSILTVSQVMFFTFHKWSFRKQVSNLPIPITKEEILCS